MKTERALNLFLASRRSRGLSKSTIETYCWTLARMAEMYPDELPQTKNDLQQIFIENTGVDPTIGTTKWPS